MERFVIIGVVHVWETFVIVGVAHAYNTGKLCDSGCGTCVQQESFVIVGVAHAYNRKAL